MSRLAAIVARSTLLSAALVLSLAGCAKNDGGTLLTPTGIRPLPEHPEGGLEGFVRHDSTNYAGLSGSPYPTTFVTLLRGATILGADTVSGEKRGFRFEGIAPGSYTLVARSHAFQPASLGPVMVRDVVRDAGDLFMTAAPESLRSLTFVIGTMPGFSIDELGTFSTLMEQSPIGIWTYPDTDTSTAVTSITAGTYRFKFVTDKSSSASQLIGWGGDSTEVLTAPLSGARVRFGSSPATDLKVTFPVTGEYAFTLDERRLTFSIQPHVPSPALGAARGASARSRR